MGSAQAFRIGIIGAGGIAKAHAAAAKDSGGRVELIAVADPQEAGRTALATAAGAKAFASSEELLASAKSLDLHGVVVCTPPSVRIGIVKDALARGIAVLAEKPLAHTVEDARTLAALAQSHPRTFTAVAYCHRLTPAIREMKRLVAEGRIGTLERFENAFACDLPGHETKWMSDKAMAGGGAFIDMGCHSLDLYHFLVGPSKVAGAVFFNKWAGRTETAASVLVKLDGPGAKNIPSGVAGVIMSGWSETCRFTIALYGTAGGLLYDYERPTELVFKDLNGKAETMTVETHEVRFARQLTAFADAARGGANPGLADFRQGLLAAEAVAAAERAAAN